MQLPLPERPMAPPFPDLPHWSENFCLSAVDPTRGVALWLHLGRWRKDLTMWRETVILHWPDGTISGYRAYGNARETKDGAGGPNFAVRAIEDGRKFGYSFLGGVQRVPSLEMKQGLLRDGPRHRAAFDLVFESDAGIWDLHRVGSKQAFLGTGHIEQIGRVTGTVSIGDETFDFDGMGNRDHSMGPRDTPSLGSHHWLQGYFENGISFLVYDAVLRGGEAPVFCTACVYEGDTMYEAELSMPWRVPHTDQYTDDFGFTLTYANGSLEIRTRDIGQTAFLSFTVPNDHYIGVYPAGDPPLTLLEQTCRYTLGGSVAGFGRLERTVPGVIARD